MADVGFTPLAKAELDSIIASHSLPPDSRMRVKNSLAALAEFPQLGAALGGKFQGCRFVLGPWRWMVFVYRWNEPGDSVEILAVQDARMAGSATAQRPN